MFHIYVNESGDTGTVKSPTRYFILTGLVLHELSWQRIIDELYLFRKQINKIYGIKLRDELHAAELLNNPGEFNKIRKDIRLNILKRCLDWLAAQNDISIINIVVDKQNKTGDVFEIAWLRLIQRFENTISHRNFPGPQNSLDKGLIFHDQTDDKKLQKLTRRMRRFNPIPNTSNLYNGGSRNLRLSYIIEDPIPKDSAQSNLIQMVDIISYFLKQKYDPNSYIKKKGAKNYFDKLTPILCTHASKLHPLGIVEV